MDHVRRRCRMGNRSEWIRKMRESGENVVIRVNKNMVRVINEWAEGVIEKESMEG